MPNTLKTLQSLSWTFTKENHSIWKIFFLKIWKIFFHISFIRSGLETSQARPCTPGWLMGCLAVWDFSFRTWCCCCHITATATVTVFPLALSPVCRSHHSPRQLWPPTAQAGTLSLSSSSLLLNIRQSPSPAFSSSLEDWGNLISIELRSKFALNVVDFLTIARS